jgi:hypothetical protein
MKNKKSLSNLVKSIWLTSLGLLAALSNLNAQTNYNKFISLPPKYVELGFPEKDLPTHAQNDGGEVFAGSVADAIMANHSGPSYEEFRRNGYIKQPAQVSHNIQHD